MTNFIKVLYVYCIMLSSIGKIKEFREAKKSWMRIENTLYPDFEDALEKALELYRKKHK